MRRTLGFLLIGLLALASPAWAAGQAVLTWTDNSDNEDNFHIERTTAADVTACQSATTFVEVAVTGFDVTTFTNTGLTEGVTYCYRVNASNVAGPSGYTNIAGKTVGFTVPISPSNLVAN